MLNGSIVRLVNDRGFGFVREDHSGDEYFFHRSMVQPGAYVFDTMRVGMCVEFEPDDNDTKKGRRVETIALSLSR